MIWLADAVLVLHALIVLFIVGGLIAIWSGAALKHVWVRNRAFRLLHLAAIGVVAMLAALDALPLLRCPRLDVRGCVRGVSADRSDHMAVHSAAPLRAGATHAIIPAALHPPSAAAPESSPTRTRAQVRPHTHRAIAIRSTPRCPTTTRARRPQSGSSCRAC